MRTEKKATKSERTLILDISESKLSFARFESSEPLKRNSLILKLFAEKHPAIKKNTIHADPIAATEIVLESLKVDSNLEDTTVYFGVEKDPFLPTNVQLASTLKILEMLSKSPIKKLVLQTRSPLVLLATPILKSLQSRLNVTMAVESLDMIGSRSLDAIYPKGRERIAAADSLTKIGIETTIQFSPIVQTRNSHLRIAEIAGILNSSPCHIRIVDSQLMIPQEVPLIVDRNAHRKLFNLLTGKKGNVKAKNLLAA